MSQGFEYDVFLSYSSNDEARVRRLAERLRDAGRQVWFDKWVIKPGDGIFQAIERGLQVARTLVLCLSPTALESDWVGLERSTVLFRDPSNAGRRFIPLLLADCALPDTLRRYKYVDYRQETEGVFKELLQVVPLSSPSEPRSEPPVNLGAPSELNFSKEFVRELHVADDRFLQVLLSRFPLHRRWERGSERFELYVTFDDGALAIWNQEGKRHLLSRLPADRRAQYQSRLDEFLLHRAVFEGAGQHAEFGAPGRFLRAQTLAG